MPKVSVAIFADNAIRVLSSGGRRDNLSFLRTESYTPQEFSAYLTHDSSSTYLLLSNSPELIYETIMIPPVVEKLMPTLVRSELQRRYPELGVFSFSYQVVSEMPIDGRVVRKVACCLMHHDIANGLLADFITHHKSVMHIASVPVVLSALIQSVGQDDVEAQLCIYDEGTRKTMFLLERGAVVFVRHVPSAAVGLDEDDLNNVSMTLDYCFQTLRIRPERTLALNIRNCPDHIQVLNLAKDLGDPSGEKVACCLPALAVLDRNICAHESLTPVEYVQELKQQWVLKRATAIFALLAVVSLLLLGELTYRNARVRAEFHSLKTPQTTLSGELAAYQSNYQQFAALEPQVKALDSAQKRMLMTQLFASVVAPSGRTLTLNQVQVLRDAARSSVKIGGGFKSTDLAPVQREFELYAREVAKRVGLALSEYKIDPGTGTFSVSLE